MSHNKLSTGSHCLKNGKTISFTVEDKVEIIPKSSPPRTAKPVRNLPIKKQERKLIEKADKIMTKLKEINRESSIKNARDRKHRVPQYEPQLFDLKLGLPEDVTAKVREMLDTVADTITKSKQSVADLYEDIKDNINDILPKASQLIIALVLVAAIIYIVKKVIPYDRLKGSAMFAGVAMLASASVGDVFCEFDPEELPDGSDRPAHFGLMFIIKTFVQEVKDLFGLNTICDWVTSGFKKGTTRPEPEIDDETHVSLDLPFGKATLTMLFSLLTTTCSIDGLKDLRKTDFYLRFINSWIKAEKFGASIMEITSYILTKITEVTSWLKVKVMGGKGFSIKQTQFREVNEWCDAVQKICTDIHLAKKSVSIATGDELWNLKMMGLKLLGVDYGNPQISAQVKGVLNATMQALLKTMGPFENLHLVGGGPRTEPVAVMLCGKTGIGKSLATYRLLVELLTKTLPEDQLLMFQQHFESFVYVRESEGKYWTGYHGQWATVFDDFAAARDAAGTPDNEYFDFLRCINTFPHYCNMADLGSKGNVLYRSKFILATSNTTKINTLSMNNDEAINRRPLKFMMLLKPQYEQSYINLNSEMPEKKLSRECLEKATGYNTDWHEFQPLDASGSNVGPAISFNEFVAFLVSEFNTKQQIATKYLNDLRDTTKILVEERIGKSQNEKQAFGEDTVLMSEDDEDVDQFEQALRNARIDPIEQDRPPLEEEQLHSAINNLLVQADDCDLDSDSNCGNTDTTDSDTSECELAPEYDSYDHEWTNFKNKLFSHADWSSLKDSGYTTSAASTHGHIAHVKVSRLCKIVMECQNLHGFEFSVNPIYTIFILCKASDSFAKVFWEEVGTPNSSYRKSFLVLRNAAIWKLFFPTLKKHIAVLTQWDFRSAEGRKKLLEMTWLYVKNLYHKIKGKYWLLIHLSRFTALMFTFTSLQSMWTNFTLEKSEAKRWFVANRQDASVTTGSKKFFSNSDRDYEDFINEFGFKHYQLTPIQGGTFFKKGAWMEPFMVEALTGKYCVVEDTSEFIQNNWVNGKPSFGEKRGCLDLMKDNPYLAVLETPQSNHYESGRVNAGRSLKATRLHRATTGQKVDEKGAGVQMNDEALINISDKIVHKNTYNVYKYHSEDINGYAGMLTFVGPKIALFPLHYIATYRRQYNDGKRFDLAIEKMDESVAYVFSVKNFIDHTHSSPALSSHDVCMVDLSFIKELPAHSSIVDHFVKRDAKVLELRSFDILLTVPRADAIRQWFSHAHVQKRTVIDDGPNSYCIDGILKYACQTAKGDCGALIYVNNKYNSQGKIIAMHVAGRPDTQTGIACILHRDLIEAGIGAIARKEYNGFTASAQPPHGYISGAGVQMADSNNFLPFKGNFEFLKHTKLAVHSPPFSQIMRSNMYGIFGPSYRSPAKLKPFELDGVKIDPMYQAIERYGEKPFCYDDKTFGIMRQAVIEEAQFSYNNSVHSPRIAVIGIREAVLGIQEIPYCSSIPRKTSAGWPYSVTKPGGKSGKFHFFGSGEAYDLDTAEFAQLEVDVMKAWEQLSEGIMPEFVFTDILKDELLKHEKVRIGKTRLVSGCPLVLLIVTRMLFMGWMQWNMENHVVNGQAPGINVYGDMWDCLMKQLTSKSEYVIPGDISGLDTSEQFSIFKLILDHDIQPFYDDGYYNMRLMVIEALSHSHHVVGDIIYKWFKNMPSGCPLTTPLNTKYVRACIRGAFYVATGLPFGSYDKYISTIVYGDDNIVNVSKEIVSIFGFTHLRDAMAKVGLTFTSEDKNDPNPPQFKLITEAGFLKRGFRFEPLIQRTVAPLELKVILDMINWTKRGMLSKEITENNVEQCLIELSLHDPEVYDKYAPKLINESRVRLAYAPNHVDRRANIDFIIGELAFSQ